MVVAIVGCAGHDAIELPFYPCRSRRRRESCRSSTERGSTRVHQRNEHGRRSAWHPARRARADVRRVRPLVFHDVGDGRSTPSVSTRSTIRASTSGSTSTTSRIPTSLSTSFTASGSTKRYPTKNLHDMQSSYDDNIAETIECVHRPQLRLRAERPRARRVRHGHLAVGHGLARRARGLSRRGPDDERHPTRDRATKAATSRCRTERRPRFGGPSASTRSRRTRPRTIS